MITVNILANIVIIMIKCALMFSFRSQNVSVVSVIAISNCRFSLAISFSLFLHYRLIRFIHTANPACYVICSEIRVWNRSPRNLSTFSRRKWFHACTHACTRNRHVHDANATTRSIRNLLRTHPRGPTRLYRLCYERQQRVQRAAWGDTMWNYLRNFQRDIALWTAKDGAIEACNLSAKYRSCLGFACSFDLTCDLLTPANMRKKRSLQTCTRRSLPPTLIHRYDMWIINLCSPFIRSAHVVYDWP